MRTPCGRRVRLSFQLIERFTIFVIVAFEPVRDLSSRLASRRRSQSDGKSDARDADVRTPSLRDTSHLVREHECSEVQAVAAHGGSSNRVE